MSRANDSNPGCSHTELTARIVAVESGFHAFKELMGERDTRYSQRAKSQDEAVAAALQTSEKAITKAEGATEKRLESLNELRAMAVDQAKNFARSDEVNLIIKALDDRIKSLSDLVQHYTTAQLARGSGMRELWGYVIGAAGLIVVIVDIYFHR